MISFKDKINNIIENNKSVSLRFLNLEEQTYLRKKKNVVLDGGYIESERKRAYFYGYSEVNIIPLKISYNKKYLELTHQNILGTLLSLGITIDSIGDILPKQGIFFITKEISKEVFTSFTKINNVSIELSIYDGVISSEQEFKEYRTTLESLRLDLVVSKICKISRKDASLMIEKELIKVNQQVQTKITTLIKENDILSIRKHGRFRINDTKGHSKKGKTILKFAKYI